MQEQLDWLPQQMERMRNQRQSLQQVMKRCERPAKPRVEAYEATGEVCEIFAGTVVASIVIICSSQQ